MNIENLKLALALNREGRFEKKHFGDTYKFAIYNIGAEKLVDAGEIINDYIDMDKASSHGSAAKGNAIVTRLKDAGVSILVSRQFGKNIKIINNHFIPVIIYDENPDSILPVLQTNINLLFSTLHDDIETYATFIIKNEELKKIEKT